MSEIKAGDLVMVVKPALCCGISKYIGHVFTVAGIDQGVARCGVCGSRGRDTVAYLSGGPNLTVSRLKKIDPLAEGDSLPTRRDLEVPAC
jgi:hypothetical protein